MDNNILVHKERCFVNAIYKLTLSEQRLFHYAIAKTNPFRHKFGEYYLIEIKKLIDFFNIKSSDAYKHFYEAVEKLFNRQCTYYSNTLEQYVTCRLIVDKIQNQKGIIGLRFSDQVASMISNDKDFLSYKLNKTINITSPNANRLYEILLYHLQKCPINKLIKIISVKELKNLMGLNKKYSFFCDFKKHVLCISKSQVNKHSDININYEIIKTGRTPTHIKFSAKYKKNQSQAEFIEDQKPQPKVKNLKNTISNVASHQLPTEEQLKLRKEKWQSVKAELKNKL